MVTLQNVSVEYPQEEPKVKSEDQLWKEAMDKKAKEEMEAFIKRKNANK